jgi:hypothetical protein
MRVVFSFALGLFALGCTAEKTVEVQAVTVERAPPRASREWDRLPDGLALERDRMRVPSSPREVVAVRHPLHDVVRVEGELRDLPRNAKGDERLANGVVEIAHDDILFFLVRVVVMVDSDTWLDAKEVSAFLC